MIIIPYFHDLIKESVIFWKQMGLATPLLNQWKYFTYSITLR